MAENTQAPAMLSEERVGLLQLAIGCALEGGDLSSASVMADALIASHRAQAAHIAAQGREAERAEQRGYDRRQQEIRNALREAGGRIVLVDGPQEAGMVVLRNERAEAAERRAAELEAQVQRLTESMEPFSKYAVHQLDRGMPRAIAEDDGTPVWGDEYAGEPVISVGDLKRLRAALTQPSTEAPRTIIAPWNPCLEKIKPGEPFFVLLGRDEQAAAAVRCWSGLREAIRGPSEKTRSAYVLADEMDLYRGAEPGSATEAPTQADGRVTCQTCNRRVHPEGARIWCERSATIGEDVCPYKAPIHTTTTGDTP